MFGAFRPSAPLSGGLLWKIPWRLSPSQKIRHRRRLRRVDNVVAILDSALKRQPGPHNAWAAPPTSAPEPNISTAVTGSATPEELSTTAEGQRLLKSARDADIEGRRNGRGPRQGDLTPTTTPVSDPIPAPSLPHMINTPTRLLRDIARDQGTIKLIERWKSEMPTEQEMLPRDKYTIFDKKVRGYRKAIHKLPKWTRVSQRLNPPGF